MHHLRLILAVAALALAGCGAEEERAAAPKATATATPPGAHPRSVTYDLRANPDAFEALPGGRLALTSGDPVKAAAVHRFGPPTRVEAEILLPVRGRAGVFCGPYAVAVAADGAYALYRDGEPVLDGRVEPGGRSDAGEPTLVRLLCDRARVGFMINAGQIQFARDTDPSAKPPDGRVGAFGIGPGDDARYLAFAASESVK